LLPSLVLVCVLLLLAIPGNLLAVHVYAFKMNQSTSGYFIMTLAISDLITCAISLPVETALILNFWSFDWTTLFKCSRYISAAMNNTFYFILAAIAVERFRSIYLPLKPKFIYACIAYPLIKGIEFVENKNSLLQRQGSQYFMTS